MLIRWKYDIELNVIKSFDEEIETADENPETFKQNTSSAVDIIEDNGESVDMQFGDGSMAYNVPKTIFTVEVE